MRTLWILSACTALAAAPAPVARWNNIPLSFEPNIGQRSYLARGRGFTLFLDTAGTTLAGQHGTTLRTGYAGANPAAAVVNEDRQSSISNYLIGNDPQKWRLFVPNFGRIRYSGIYPGIDLVYYGRDGELEYDWIVSAGADPRSIRLVIEGADRLRIDQRGDLLITLGVNEYRHRKPVAYQESAGARTEVDGKWVLRGKECRFQLGDYDHGRTLVIDPILKYSTYLGGNGLDYANALAVDAAGNTYVTGSVGSANFPTTGPYQGSLRGTTDVFVTKFNASGSAKIYSTYLGSSGADEGKGIAVDIDGNAYITGSAGFSDFPMKNPIQGTWGGSGDAFVTKLDPTGSALVYSTYLGGSSTDSGTAIALDSSGAAYIVGITFSTNFPTVAPFQAAKGSQQDAFVAKINAAGSAWVYATYLGGNDVDEGYAIAADASGNAYVTGYTASTNFPLQSPLRGSNASSVDAFVTKLNSTGSALVFSTYFGGSATDFGTAIAVDSSGVYVTGPSASSDLLLVNPYQTRISGPGVDDVFVMKLNPAGSALIYSTYLGGGSNEESYALAIDTSGNAYITGRTNSSDFPLLGAIQSQRTAFDIFVTELNSSGSSALFSTFVGGTGSESGRGIAVDRSGNLHVAGETTSTDFPVANAAQGTNGGGPVPQDAVVLLFGNNPFPAAFGISKTHSGSFTQGQSQGSYTVTVSNTGGSPTSGTVTVTEAVAVGEALTSMSGSGWNCSLNVCTRADALAAGLSYPAITVLVSVASNAPATVTNQVSVSGGGTVTATAVDPTTIMPSGTVHSPSVVSLFPVSSVGSSQLYTFQFADTAGAADLTVMNVLINTALDGRHGCYIAYVLQSNTLYLVNDAGDAGGPYAGALALSGSGAVSNSQCTILGSGSSASTSGNTITLQLNMSFNAGFSGNKVVYLAARDSVLNNTGWQTMGVHGVPPLPATFPIPVSVSPSSGSSSNVTFAFTFQDATSAANLQTGWALINTAIDGRSACFVAYYKPGNQVFLYPDNGDGTQASNMVLTGSNALSNSQCTVSAQGSSVTSSGALLIVNLNVTFKAPFTGPKGVWMAVQALSGQTSAWQAMGAWKVP